MSDETRELVPVEAAQMTVTEVQQKFRDLAKLKDTLMKHGTDYGTIPGCKKDSLWQPGADKIMSQLRLVPKLEWETTKLPDGHREVEATCTLIHHPTGNFAGQGAGLCTTMEAKYRYRKTERKCPHCGEPTVKRSRPDRGGGWYCWAKIGGCGAQFQAGDDSIESQAPERTENPDLADTYNTVLKMALKRAKVAAVINTGVSEFFTQDVEDMPREAFTEKETPVEVVEPQRSEAPNSTRTQEPTRAQGGADYEVLGGADAIPKDYKDKKAYYVGQGFGCKKIKGEWYWVTYRRDNEAPPVEAPPVRDIVGLLDAFRVYKGWSEKDVLDKVRRNSVEEVTAQDTEFLDRSYKDTPDVGSDRDGQRTLSTDEDVDEQMARFNRG